MEHHNLLVVGFDLQQTALTCLDGDKVVKCSAIELESHSNKSPFIVGLLTRPYFVVIQRNIQGFSQTNLSPISVVRTE